jgi:predicted DsbA family dithiol-disulfide isomerase
MNATPAPTAGRPLTIDVWSDMVCPWCWLGKRRFELALSRRPDLPIAVRWRPYELNPDLPAGGMDRGEYMRQKFGSEDRLKDSRDRLVSAGAAVGLDYRFDRATRMPNTRAAHALARLSGQRQVDVTEALFAAYFRDGRDIGDLDVLAEIGAAHGLDPTDVRTRLAAREDFDAIEREEREAYAGGISGVPFFVFAAKWAVSGAQETEAFLNAIDAVHAELAKVPPRG